MTKAKVKHGYPPMGGGKPIADGPPPKGNNKAAGNKLPKHAMHARGKNRGMGKA
jgi:hypothetical protein